eukprot:scaffold33661_cov19-Tisochrysis_lutea.AAC.1
MGPKLQSCGKAMFTLVMWTICEIIVGSQEQFMHMPASLQIKSFPKAGKILKHTLEASLAACSCIGLLAVRVHLLAEVRIIMTCVTHAKNSKPPECICLLCADHHDLRHSSQSSSCATSQWSMACAELTAAKVYVFPAGGVLLVFDTACQPCKQFRMRHP